MSKWTHPNTSKVIESEEQKMNEYLYEMTMDLSDEEFMLVVHNNKLHTNRRKNYQKENEFYGEESNYDIYC